MLEARQPESKTAIGQGGWSDANHLYVTDLKGRVQSMYGAGRSVVGLGAADVKQVARRLAVVQPPRGILWDFLWIVGGVAVGVVCRLGYELVYVLFASPTRRERHYHAAAPTW